MKPQFLVLRRTLPTILMAGFLYLTFLAVFVPLNPSQPSSGLDPSWAFALNHAVAQGLVFGKDIVFTFGPYASIYTEAFHPATDRLMVFGSLYLALCYASLSLFLSRNTPLRWILAFGVFIAGYSFSSFSRDALIFSYPLLVAIAVYRITLPDGNEGTRYLSRKAAILFALFFTPLGLLPLIKGSFLLISGVTLVLCFLILWHNKRPVFAFASILLPFAAMVLFWLVSGQPISGLPYYFISMVPTISGYTESMAIETVAISVTVTELFLYVVAAAAMMFVLGTEKEVPFASRSFLLLAFAVFLFVSFKAGFVRHDGHAITAATSIVIAAILLNFAIRHKVLNMVLLLSALAWIRIDIAHLGSSPPSLYAATKDAYGDAFDGLKMRLFDHKKLDDHFYQKVAAIKARLPIEPMDGTTDIYSFNQSYLLASQNRWSPRPVIQSYAVSTPSLARLNESHLIGERAPDNVILRVEPIDRRLPSLEDGLSWPTLIKNYSPRKFEKDFLYLTKNEVRNTVLPRVEVFKGIGNLGEEVVVPSSSIPLFAEVDIRPTLIGRIISFIYKAPALEMSIELMNGRRANYRIVSAMVRSGFLISPLVETTAEFALIFGDSRYLSHKLVKSIRVSSRGGGSVFWNSQFTIRLTKLDKLADHDVAKLAGFDNIQAKISSDGR